MTTLNEYAQAGYEIISNINKSGVLMHQIDATFVVVGDYKSLKASHPQKGLHLRVNIGVKDLLAAFQPGYDHMKSFQVALIVQLLYAEHPRLRGNVKNSFLAALEWARLSGDESLYLNALLMGRLNGYVPKPSEEEVINGELI